MFDKYIVNQDGSIISKYTGKQVYTFVNNKGYHFVRLYVDGVAKTFLAHRVVAMVHIPNPDNLPEVNHLDGNKSNNAVSNLEWTTGKKNAEHAVKAELVKRGIDRPNAVLTDEQVLELRRLREVEKLTYYALAEKFGISYQGAHKVCSRMTYTHI